MIIKIKGKEYKIKFGYKPTLKERIISKVVRFSNITNENDLEKIEDLLLFLPELILVGLQVNHEDFRYNIDTGEGKEKQLEKSFNLIEEYLEEDNADILDLFVRLQEALTEDSFLSALFQKEQSSVKMQNKMAESMVAEN